MNTTRAARKKKAWQRREKKFWKVLHIKENLLRMQGGVCFFCEQPFSLQRPATIEHLKPRSMGGTNHFDNLALTHEKCNHKRQTQSWLAFVAYATNELIRKHWPRYIITGYLPRLHRLSSRNPVYSESSHGIT